MADFITTIESMDLFGNGVGQQEGKPVNISKTTIGDVVRFEKIRENKRGTEGRLLEVVKQGPLRVLPLARTTPIAAVVP